MKKTSLIPIIILVLLSHLLIGQTKVDQTADDDKEKRHKKVTYNFLDNSLNGNNKYWVKQNGSIDFNLRDINLFLYDVKINQEKQSYINEEGNVNTSFDVKADNFDLKTLDKYLSQVSVHIQDLSKNILIDLTNTTTTNQQDTASYFNSIIRSVTTTSTQIKSDEQILKILKQNVDKYPEKLKAIRKYQDSLTAAQKEINKALIYYNLLLNTLYTDGHALDKLIITRDSITKRFYGPKSSEAKESGISPALENIIINENTINDMVSTIKDEIGSLISTTKYIKISVEQLNNKETKDRLKNALDLDASLENLTLINNSLTNALSDMRSGIFEVLHRNIASVYNSFNQNNFNVNYRLNNLDDYDRINFNVSIKPRRDIPFSKPIRTEEFSITTTTYRGIKFDVSSGLCFNFNLNDKIYNYDSLSVYKKDTVKIVEAKDQNNYYPFICTQLNIYSKPFRANLGLGICIGISTNLSKIRYSFGGCVVLGKEEKFVISGGVAGGEIKTLAEGFQLDTYYPRKYMPTEPKVTDHFRVGPFLSLTYNLKGKKTKEFGDRLVK